MALIGDPAERAARAEAKRAAVLAFLASEVWSSVQIIGQVAGLNARQPTERLLKSLEKDGLIRRCNAPVIEGQGVAIWGITPGGRASCPTADPLGAVLEPSKLALSTIPHALAIQSIRLRCEAAGWMAWTRGESLGKDVAIRPDVIVTMPSGAKVALEIERTIKTPKRYVTILAAHLAAIQAGKWVGVYYVAPAPVARGLVRLFNAVRLLPGGIPFDAARRNRFRVVIDGEFPPSSQGE